MSPAKTRAPLPSSYTNILPLSSQKQGVLKVPSTSTQCSLNGDEEAVLMATRKETEWLDHTTKHLEENKVTDYENVTTLQTKTAGNGKAASKKTETMVSWSAYHGERQQHVNTRCHSSLLPLFAECAHSLAMIKHAIIVVMKAVEHLNPGQTAVIAFDQPLFALGNTVEASRYNGRRQASNYAWRTPYRIGSS